MREVEDDRPLVAPADRALVVFVRNSMLGWAIRAPVMDEQTNFLGTAVAGGHFSVLRPPGKQKFVVWSEAADIVDADLAAGLVYFVEVTPAMGVWRARFNFRASHRGTELFPYQHQWIADTKRYEVDTALAKEETAGEDDERREALKQANERLRGYSGSDLTTHTLLPDDGHSSVGVPGNVRPQVRSPAPSLAVPVAPLPTTNARPPVAAEATQAAGPAPAAGRGYAKGTLLRVKLKNGTTWMGELVVETGQGLLLATGSGTQMLAFTDILAVDQLGPAQ